MHPIFRNKGWFAIYLVAYAALGLLLTALFQAQNGAPPWKEILALMEPLCVFFSVFCLTPWYICRQLPLAATAITKLLLYHIGAAVASTVLGIGLAAMVAYSLNLGASLNYLAIPLVLIGFLLYLLSVALHYVLLALEASRRAAVEARDAELRALKAQINPHFLFNSLNSIIALIASDPGGAREMCIRLADFLRSTLGLGERDAISWSEELSLAQAYLDVEQIRFGSRLQVEMDVAENCRGCPMPPLLLQPLVENAVKHGIAGLVEGGTIRIQSALRDGQLRITVENLFDDQSSPSSQSGLGLRNLRMRLETRFGAAARLATRTEGNRFIVDMTVPC
jgi:two-component system, LytTR family, sensor histidine kinase AlgZ